jgi:Tol biopolymer transport system component
MSTVANKHRFNSARIGERFCKAENMTKNKLSRIFRFSLLLGVAQLACSDATGPRLGDAAFVLVYGVTHLTNDARAAAIYVATEDGRSQRLLVDLPGTDFDPVWSPDGRSVAFAHLDSAFTHTTTYIVNADGTGLRALGTEQNDWSDPAWMADGQHLVVTYNSRSTHGLAVVAADGSSFNPIAGAEGGNYPTVSPDGSTVLFNNLSGEIRVIAVGGGQATVVTTGAAASWSPDGRSIAYVDQSSGLRVSNTDGSASRLIVPPALNQGAFLVQSYRPAWSPDGKRLLLVAAFTDIARNVFDYELYSVDTGGGTPVDISNTISSHELQGDWRRNGPVR